MRRKSEQRRPLRRQSRLQKLHSQHSRSSHDQLPHQQRMLSGCRRHRLSRPKLLLQAHPREQPAVTSSRLAAWPSSLWSMLLHHLLLLLRRNLTMRQPASTLVQLLPQSLHLRKYPQHLLQRSNRSLQPLRLLMPLLQRSSPRSTLLQLLPLPHCQPLRRQLQLRWTQSSRRACAATGSRQSDCLQALPLLTPSASLAACSARWILLK